jgi:glutamine synthetase
MTNAPELPSLSETEPGEYAERLAALGVRNLLVTMIDQAGIARVKLIPVARSEAALSRGVSFSLTSALLLCADDAIAVCPGYPPALGDVRLLADAQLLRWLDAGRGLVWAPADQLRPEGGRFPTCQRHALASQDAVLRRFGLETLAAFEVEFTLFRGAADAPEPVHRGPAYGLQPMLDLEEWADDVLLACEAAGLAIQQLHPEYGTGQYELSLQPASPVRAADELVLVRLIVQRISARHGLRASFAPVTSTDGLGNGCHLHLSARDERGNVFADTEAGQGMRPPGAAIIAGLVDLLPETTALLAPSVNSYDRLRPGRFSGATACWGVENREAAIRYIPGASGQRDAGANIEVKPVDGAANPYLALAAILATAATGIRDGRTAPMPVTGDPATVDDEAARGARIASLPATLGEALGLLDRSTVLRTALGDDIIDTLLAVRGHEWETYGERPAAERIAALRWKQ